MPRASHCESRCKVVNEARGISGEVIWKREDAVTIWE